MQIRRRKTTKRRKTRRTMSEGLGARKTTRRSRTHRRRKRGLSEMFSAPAAEMTAKSIAYGLVGAFVGVQINKVFADQKPLTRGLIIGGLAFVSGALIKWPYFAAGMAGGGIMPNLLQPATMAENNFLSQNELESLPPVLSESYLSAGQYDYMSEDTPYNYLEGTLDR